MLRVLTILLVCLMPLVASAAVPRVWVAETDESPDSGREVESEAEALAAGRRQQAVIGESPKQLPADVRPAQQHVGRGGPKSGTTPNAGHRLYNGLSAPLTI